MDRHHADDQQRPPCVLAPQRSHRVPMVVFEVALRHEHEADAQRNAHRGAPQTAIDALERKADARREHHTGRDCVRRPQHKPARRAHEEKRQSAKPGRQRRHQRSKEHRDDIWLRQGSAYATNRPTGRRPPPPSCWPGSGSGHGRVRARCSCVKVSRTVFRPSAAGHAWRSHIAPRRRVPRPSNTARAVGAVPSPGVGRQPFHMAAQSRFASSSMRSRRV